jgi:hypothetical protein
VGLEECLLISEYFGVSFEACVKTVCFRVKRFNQVIDNKELDKLIRKFKPDNKRKELFESTDDLSLLINALKYSHFSSLELNNIIGIKFIQNLHFFD